MTGGGIARRLGHHRRLVRAWAVVAAAVVVLGAGAAQVASAGTQVARPGPVAQAARPMHPDTPGPQCFFVFPACASANPTATWVMTTGNNDSTGCTFKQDTAWGDGSPDSIVTYPGGKPNTTLATFAHTYRLPGSFQISYSITVPVNPHGKCQGTSNNLQFTLLKQPVLNCLPSQVTVPGSTVSVPIGANPVSLTYGSLPLTFTPAAAPSKGSLCTMLPATTQQSVDLNVPGAMAPIPLGSTDTTATIDLLKASKVATTVPLCDFGPLQALANPSTTPPLTDFAHTNNCLLTPTFHASWDVVARWTVPSGIVQMAHNQVTNTDTEIYSTQPLTYYVDLDTLPLPDGFSGDAMSPLVNFIYSTLAQNLPVLDRIALISASSGHLLVVNPFGRPIGLDGKNQTHAFAGVGYAEVGGTSIAWILEPVLGDYHVSVRAASGSTFGVDVADLQFLGHGSTPLIENFTWQGTLGPTGTATKPFSVRGTALSPVVTPHVSKTRVKPHTQVRFTLTGSVIPLGIGTVIWHFGDGTKATGRPMKHRYAKPGRYTPTVTVTDAVGYTVTVNLPTIVVKR